MCYLDVCLPVWLLLAYTRSNTGINIFVPLLFPSLYCGANRNNQLRFSGSRQKLETWFCVFVEAVSCEMPLDLKRIRREIQVCKITFPGVDVFVVVLCDFYQDARVLFIATKQRKGIRCNIWCNLSSCNKIATFLEWAASKTTQVWANDFLLHIVDPLKKKKMFHLWHQNSKASTAYSFIWRTTVNFVYIFVMWMSYRIHYLAFKTNKTK